MLDHLRIRNYRLFRELDVPRLSRVNVVAGRNNAGKTALLEAVFLLSGAGHPHLAMNANILRTAGTDSEARMTKEALVETLWKPFFFDFDAGNTIEIAAAHEPSGDLSMKIALAARRSIALPVQDAGRTDLTPMDELVFTFQQGEAESVRTAARLVNDKIEFDHHQEFVPFSCSLTTSRRRTDHDDAVRLGALRKRKQGDLLLEALQVIEPRLRSIEDNSASGSPMIWGDIGLSELVPLSVMGDGMTRFASIVLAMADVPAGVVLIDEIENGLHHSVLADVWRVIDNASRRFDVQVFATTHSFECAQAADQAIKTDALSLHRLGRDDDGTCHCVTYDRGEIAAAIRHDIEVR